jgi:hypothetical protein
VATTASRDSVDASRTAPPALRPSWTADLAERLATSIPTDVVQCTYLEELSHNHQRLSDPGVHIDTEHPDGTVAARTEAITGLLRDARFASVPWADATLTDAYASADPAGALLVFAFPHPVKVPTILGVPDEHEGDATTTTDAKGYGQMRPLTPDEAKQFAAAREVQVSVDQRGEVPVVASVRASVEPEMCRLSQVPQRLR